MADVTASEAVISYLLEATSNTSPKMVAVAGDVNIGTSSRCAAVNSA